MNILVVFTFDISLNDWRESGLLSREVKYYKYLCSLNNNVTFLTFGDKIDENFQKELGNIKVVPVYKKIKYSNSRFIRTVVSFTIPFRFKKEFSDIEVIKTNQLLGSWVAIILKYVLKKPLIIRTGYDLFKFKIKQSKNIIVISLSYLLTLISLNLCNFYTTTSSEDLDYLEKYYFFNSKKLKLIPNWVEIGNAPTYESRFDNRILMVGRLESQKNFIKIIEILKNSPIEIDIYGEGSQKDLLIKKSKEFNVSLNLKGSIENKDLLGVYSQYKLYVSTSLYEGNPKTILEAMSKGCLILSLENKSTSSLLKNRVNSITFTNKQSNVNKIIDGILNNFKDYHQIAINGYENILENNSIENIAKKEIELLNKI